MRSTATASDRFGRQAHSETSFSPATNEPPRRGYNENARLLLELDQCALPTAARYPQQLRTCTTVAAAVHIFRARLAVHLRVGQVQSVLCNRRSTKDNPSTCRKVGTKGLKRSTPGEASGTHGRAARCGTAGHDRSARCGTGGHGRAARCERGGHGRAARCETGGHGQAARCETRGHGRAARCENGGPSGRALWDRERERERARSTRAL